MSAARLPLRTVAGTAVVLLFFSALTLLTRGQAARLRERWPPEADLMYLPTSHTLRVLALGHTELASDLVAARANVYYGSQVLSKAPPRWLDQYVQAAIDLDPHNQPLYMTGAAMIIYDGKAITADTVLKANAVLERGIEAFPADWNLYFQIGFNYFYELPNAAGASDHRIPGWRQKGVEALRQAALFEEVPAWLPNLVARLLTQQGADELAVRHLEQAYAATSSAETREQIRAKLELLQGKQVLQQIEEGRRQLEAEIAAAYPYAPEAFSLITGPRQPRWVESPGRTSRASPPTP